MLPPGRSSSSPAVPPDLLQAYGSLDNLWAGQNHDEEEEDPQELPPLVTDVPSPLATAAAASDALTAVTFPSPC